MALTKRNKILIIIFAALTLINLGAAVSVFLRLQNQSKGREIMMEGSDPSGDAKYIGPRMMMNELGFSEEQAEELKFSKDILRQNTQPHMSEIRRINQLLIDEVLKAEPDTTVIKALCEKIGENHAQMRFHSAMHLIDMRTIATPDQYAKLEGFFREMIMRGDGMKGDGPRYRHRRGQN
jgi:Spy/CpxP family protein refolding chaperone